MDLTLVPFSSSRQADQLGATLLDLGYSVVTVSPSHWLDAAQLRFAGPAVLFLEEEGGYPREPLLRTLAEPHCPPSIAVLDAAHGAWDCELLARCREFLAWPCRRDELRLRLERVVGPRADGAPGTDPLALIDEFVGLNLTGRSPAFLRALATIKKVARCDAPVLIEGETGTGKEAAARAIHYLSARRDGPFIPVNCGAIPDNLIENELFGHERGAYTDAKAAQAGLIAQAERGTLFLDEIDALSPKAQSTLLRFLQDRQFKALGSSILRQADVRVVTASNAALAGLVEAGGFRQDLYYRLNILNIALPPLRARAGDPECLARHFIERYAELYGRPAKSLHPASVAWLNSHSWPGNVRELENLVHRELLLAEGDTVQLHPDLAASERRHGTGDRRRRPALSQRFHDAKLRAVGEFERDYLAALLASAQGNVTVAARLAGKERRALGKLLKKHGLGRGKPSGD
jgi:DNA-binding NtrC family response regulator